MKLDLIKKAVAHLPHVKTVWVKGNEVFVHVVIGAEKIELEAPVQTVQPHESIVEDTITEEAPVQTEEAETKSTNNKKNK